jgi:hypothetical protein
VLLTVTAGRSPIGWARWSAHRMGCRDPHSTGFSPAASCGS